MSDVDISKAEVDGYAACLYARGFVAEAELMTALRAALDAAEREASAARMWGNRMHNEARDRKNERDAARHERDAARAGAKEAVQRFAALSLMKQEVERERDAAQAALLAAWFAGRNAAAAAASDVCRRYEEAGHEDGADAAGDCVDAIRALQPPADLAAQAPGDAVAQEREACAKVAEAVMRAADEDCQENRFSGYTHSEAAAAQAAEEIANGIRARAGA